MILTGIMRSKQFGDKKPIRVAGYTRPEDLLVADTIIRASYPYARTVLFLVPKQESKQ